MNDAISRVRGGEKIQQAIVEKQTNETTNKKQTDENERTKTAEEQKNVRTHRAAALPGRGRGRDWSGRTGMTVNLRSSTRSIPPPA